MRFVGFSWIMAILAVFPSSDCATSGGRNGLCANCARPTPTCPVDEDLYHLQHNDPCFKFDDLNALMDATIGQCQDVLRQQMNVLASGGRGSQQNDPSSSTNNRQSLSYEETVHERCKSLVRLYLASPLYYGGRGSKCLNAAPLGCERHPSDFYVTFHCTVTLPGKYWGSSKKSLSDCVKEDYEWYVKRTQTYGAQHGVAETPRAAPQIQRIRGAQHGIEETPRATPQIHGSRRRRSQSPPRGKVSGDDRGRTTSRQESGTGSFFGRTRKAKSFSPTRPLLCDFTGS